MFGIPLKLLNLTRDLVDIREQPTRRFTIEASGRDERIVPLLPPGPRRRIQLGPIIPPLLGRERRQMASAWTRVKRLFGVLMSAQVRCIQ